MSDWHLLEFLFNVIDVGLIFYFTWILLKKRKITNIHLLFIILFQAILNTSINHYFGIASLSGLILMLISTGLLFKIVLKQSILLIWLYVILGLMLNFIIEMSVISISIFIIGKSPQIFYESTTARLLGTILSKTTYYLISRYLITRIKINNPINKSIIYQIYLLLIPNLVIIFLGIWFQRYINIFHINSKQYIMMITITVILFTAGMVSIIRKIIEYTEKQVEWNMKEQEYIKQQFYIENIEDMMKSLKAQRHDFNHHLNTLYGLIRLDHIKETKEYIEKLTNETQDFNYIINSTNPILSSLLNFKLNRAKKENIKFNINLDIDREIDIEGIDLSIVIGNLLQNAIEACKLINNKDEREININIYIKNNNLIIKISNSISKQTSLSEEYLSSGFTSKKDKSNHGFGLANVKNIVTKYNGIIKIDCKEQYLKVNVALPIKRGVY